MNSRRWLAIGLIVWLCAGCLDPRVRGTDTAPADSTAARESSIASEAEPRETSSAQREARGASVASRTHVRPRTVVRVAGEATPAVEGTIRGRLTVDCDPPGEAHKTVVVCTVDRSPGFDRTLEAPVSADGAFEVAHVPHGRVIVTAKRDGAFAAATVQCLTREAPIVELSIAMERTHTVRVHGVDVEGRRLTPEVILAAELGWPEIRFTDEPLSVGTKIESTRYLPPPESQIEAEKDLIRRTKFDDRVIELKKGARAFACATSDGFVLDVRQLEADIDDVYLHFDPAILRRDLGGLDVLLEDLDTGEPIEQSWLKVFRVDDPDHDRHFPYCVGGKVRLPSLRPGTYEVQAWGEHIVPRRVRVDIEAGRPHHRLTIRLLQALRITGQIQGGDPRGPLLRIRCTRLDESDERARHPDYDVVEPEETTARDTFSIECLAPGRYEVRIDDDSIARECPPVVVDLRHGSVGGVVLVRK